MHEREVLFVLDCFLTRVIYTCIAISRNIGGPFSIVVFGLVLSLIYQTVLNFSLLWTRVRVYRSFIHICIRWNPDVERTYARAPRAEDRGRSEGRSLDNALDDVAINRARRRRGGCEKRRARRGAPCARILARFASLGCTPRTASDDVLHRSHHRSKVLPIHAIGPSI